ncbi:hypothetical protein CWI36_0078p0040 [Hamiltosporidium magnivora]|uniref:Uncharacterized protein n=1 Tax=Hamiltosporidium magnivora TaxID=148818 RepID=A0A4Q9LL53_9MICR|nr:hypothetical protein CWI36_0114p0020 [Hamiltosporidium magnivora]TBU08964.1 hypothetical protein CWI36_0078p0040 [Hamiltosporidium magnivora]
MGGYKQFENKGGILEITRDTNDMGGIMDDTYNNTKTEYILLRIERYVYFNDRNPVRKLSILSEKPEFSLESYNSSIQNNYFTHEIIKQGNTVENNAFKISFFCLDKNDAQISKESNDLKNELGFKENRKKFE